jgi:mono/diheme cytochrome c family protein
VTAMKTVLKIIAATALAFLPLAALAQPKPAPAPASAAAPTGNAKHGQQVFMTVGCYQCHGTMGHGGQGPNLARLKLPVAGFQVLVRRPVGNMPAYSEKTVPDADLADIYAYLQTIPAPLDKRPAILND